MTTSVDQVQQEVRPVDGLYAGAYPELRRLARMRLGGGPRNTLLNTTALVHESYIRLAESDNLQLKDHGHFIAYAARAMRSVIVDSVRRRKADRRGGEAPHVEIDTHVVNGVPRGDDEILRVNDALQDLAKLDPRMVSIVEMRYFGGMTDAEIADSLNIADRTVRREWEKARLWLSEALQ